MKGNLKFNRTMFSNLSKVLISNLSKVLISNLSSLLFYSQVLI